MKMVMPKMGMTMEEGTIVEWKKRDGDYVKKGEVILEIMTNKVNMDLEAPASGYLKISRHADEVVPVGEVIADIEESLEEGVAKPAEEVVPGGAALTPVPKVPVSVAPGAREFPVKPVIESEISERRPASPRARLLAEENKIPLESVTGTGPGGAVTEKDVLEMIERKAVPETVSEEFESGGVSPLAERIARHRGVDLTKVRGTGIGGKITKEDVMTYLEGPRPETRPEVRPEEKPRIQEAPEVKRPPVVTETRVPEPSRMPETRILEPTPRTEPVKPTLAPELVPPEKGTQGIPLRGIRKLTAERMLKSKKEAPHLTLGMEVDMTEASKLKDSLTVTYTDIVVKAAALALKKHPMLNSTLTEDRIVLRETVNIGIAVARGEDLLVPVIHNADKLSLKEISRLTEDLIDRTKSDNLTDKDVLDGTFTLSNLGMYDIDFFTPIINPPEAAILGVGKIEKKPVIVEDKIEIRQRVTLSLSFDHRIINGMPASLFLKEIRDLLEHPYKLLVEGEQ